MQALKTLHSLEKYSDLNSLESDLNTALQSRLPDGIREGQQKITLKPSLNKDTASIWLKFLYLLKQNYYRKSTETAIFSLKSCFVHL